MGAPDLTFRRRWAFLTETSERRLHMSATARDRFAVKALPQKVATHVRENGRDPIWGHPALTQLAAGRSSSGLAGEAPGRASAEAGAAVEEAVGVDAAGEADERVDRAEHEDDRERVLPERHAHERAAGG
jgi:hypothetical protein